MSSYSNSSPSGSHSSLPSTPNLFHGDKTRMYELVSTALTRNHLNVLGILLWQRSDSQTQKMLATLHEELTRAQADESIQNTGLAALEIKTRRQTTDIMTPENIKMLGQDKLEKFKSTYRNEIQQLIGVPLGQWTTQQTLLVRRWIIHRLIREHGIIDPQIAQPSQVYREIMAILHRLNILSNILKEGEALQYQVGNTEIVSNPPRYSSTARSTKNPGIWHLLKRWVSGRG